MVNEMNNLKRLVLLARLIERSNILAACNQHHLPGEIVPLRVLEADLKKIEEQIAASGQELVIPLSKASQYYRLPLSHCSITDGRIAIHMKIPIGRRGETWKLFELITVPFAWKDKTCRVEHESAFIAVSEKTNEVRTVVGTALHHCQPFRDRLCYIPRFTANVFHGPSCTKLLYKGGNVQELSDLCPMTCRSAKQFTITEVDEELFVFTHVTHNIWVKCGEHDTHMIEKSDDPGAHKVVVPCRCEVTMDDETIIPRRFPCAESAKKAGVEHLLPVIWTTLTSMRVKIHGPRSTFDNVSHYLNSNWTMQIPYTNLTSADETLQEITKTIRVQEEHRVRTYAHKYANHGDFLFYAWNILLSICMAVVICRGRLPPAVLVASDIAHATSREESWTDEALIGMIAVAVVGFTCFVVGRCVWSWYMQKRQQRRNTQEGSDKKSVERPIPKARGDSRNNNAGKRMEVTLSTEELREVQQFLRDQRGSRYEGEPSEGV